MGSSIGATFKKMPAAFFIGYLVLFIRNYLLILQDNPLPDLADKALLVSGLIFLGLHIASNLKAYSGSGFLLLTIIGFVGLAYIRNGETSPLVSIILIVASASISDTRLLIIMWLTLTSFVVLFTVLVYAATSIISPDSIRLFTRVVGSFVTIRQGFYLSHPNLFAAIVAMMLACLMFLNKDKLNLLTVLFSLVLMTIVYYFTDSRTPYLLLVAAAILFLLVPYLSPRAFRCLRFAASVIPLVLLLIVFLLSGPLFSNEIRELFSARIGLWHSCFVNQGVSFFGNQFIPTVGIEANGYLRLYATLDSFYASCLFVYGAPFSLAFFLFSYLAVRNSDDPSMAILFLLFFAEGFTEGHLTNLIFGLPLLLMGIGVKELCRICSNSNSHRSNRDKLSGVN